MILTIFVMLKVVGYMFIVMIRMCITTTIWLVEYGIPLMMTIVAHLTNGIVLITTKFIIPKTKKLINKIKEKETYEIKG